MALDTRARILESARDLFLAGGTDAVTMRRIAAGAGVSAMAPYRHFADRDDLLRAVVDRGFAVFFEYLQRALAEPSAWARFRAAGQQYLRFALDHPRDYGIMFVQQAGCAAPAPHSATWRDAATFRFLVDRIRDCQEAGELRRGDAEQIALAVWAQCHGAVSLYLGGSLDMDEAAFGTLYLNSLNHLMQGLAAR